MSLYLPLFGNYCFYKNLLSLIFLFHSSLSGFYMHANPLPVLYPYLPVLYPYFLPPLIVLHHLAIQGGAFHSINMAVNHMSFLFLNRIISHTYVHSSHPPPYTHSYTPKAALFPCCIRLSKDVLPVLHHSSSSS